MPVGRDDPRLHPPDVSAVPAEPLGATPTRARRCGRRRTGPTRVLTVSEASKRDILRFFHVPPEQDRRRSTTRSTSGSGSRAATPRTSRACASATSSTDAVRPLRRQHQAAQEPRAADRGVSPAAAAAGARGREAADHRRRDLEVRRAAARRAPAQAAQARAVPRLRAGRDAGGALPPGRRVRLPVALRRLRAAAARGDGERHAGRSPRTSRRCRRSSATPRCSSIPYDAGGDRRRDAPRAAPTPTLRARAAAREGLARAREFSWERSVARAFDEIYARRSARSQSERGCAGRARPRLADRHARRREGARGARASSIPDATIFTLVHVHGHRCRRRSSAHRIVTSFVQWLPAAGRALPPATCRSSRPRSSSSTSTPTTS